MRRRRHQTVITVMGIIIVVLLTIIALQAFKIQSLIGYENASSNVADAGTVLSENVRNTMETDSIDSLDQNTSGDGGIHSEFTGTWVDGSNTLTIQDDGSYVWINVFESENLIFSYQEGYINEANVMIILRSYDYSDHQYQSIEDIPASEWNTEKRAGRTVIKESSETLLLSDSKYHFLKVD